MPPSEPCGFDASATEESPALSRDFPPLTSGSRMEASGLFMSNPRCEPEPTLTSTSAPVHLPIVSMISKSGRSRLMTMFDTFPIGLASTAPTGSITSRTFAATSAALPTFESVDPAFPNLPALDAAPTTGISRETTSNVVAPRARAGSVPHSSTCSAARPTSFQVLPAFPQLQVEFPFSSVS